MNEQRVIIAFSVQRFNPDVQKWRVINDRIFVRNFAAVGVDRSTAVAKALAAADREVTGWSAAFPRESYRAVPVYQQ